MKMACSDTQAFTSSQRWWIRQSLPLSAWPKTSHLSRTSTYAVSFFFQAEDGIRDYKVTGVQTCALPIFGEALLVAVIDEHVLINPTRTGRVRTDRRMHVCGKPAGNRLQILHNPRTGPVNVGPVFEDNKDVRVIEHGLRAYRLHLRRSQEGS